MIKENRASVESDLNRHHVRYEDPLWNEERERVGHSININLTTKRNDSEKGCEWNFFDAGKHVLTLPGQTLTKKQIRFLQTPDGIKFLLKKYKEGHINVSRLKSELKKLEL